MTPKTRKIVLGVGLGALALSVGYLVYRRQTGKRNSALLLEYIKSLPKENTVTARNETANAQVETVKNSTTSTDSVLAYLAKYPRKLVKFDGKIFDLKNKSQRDMAIKKATDIAVALGYSMQGAGTDLNKFSSAFKRINSNGAFILVNSIYKPTFKEDIWKAIDDEDKLHYSKSGTGYNAVYGAFIDLPNYAPVISNVAKYWVD